MLNFTPLIRPYFRYIAGQRRKWATAEGMEAVQRAVLSRLIHKAAATEVGRKYGFPGLGSYEDYRQAVPITEYEDIRPLVNRMLAGERDILWPGRVLRYAQSSGTSGGKSKYIPITGEGLNTNHYRGGAEAVASYLTLNPGSRIFSGKGFILGGSFANELGSLPDGIRVGDLSANLIDAINPGANLFRVPGKDIALMSDWTEKLPALAKASVHENITNISGVPSWFLQVILHILEISNKSSIHEVWPNLEVFFHGGIAFGPYREQYAAITDPAKMHFIENYNASEGFFAVQDTADPAAGMLMLLDAGVFFEFIPVHALGKDPTAAIPAWEVKQGKTYALIISSCNGLWRYSPGDTVRIKSVAPLRISIAGRTNNFINAFGEELMVWNADDALSATCRRTGARVANYTAAPVYSDCRTKGHHQWFIEWAIAPSCSDEVFAGILDRELQAVNSDYQAKRSGDIFLNPLELISVPCGTFDRWLASTGRLGGQRKVPRLANDRHIADAILKIIEKQSQSDQIS